MNSGWSPHTGIEALGRSRAAAPLQRAALGSLTLDSGERLTDAVVTYRTAGTLCSDRTNGVLLLPWFQGTSADMLQHIGDGRLADPARHFVIAVDAFGNGQASSPSNSSRQHGWAFPRFSIADIVNSHRRLLTDVLTLPSLHAVVGVSMGAMQVFEWIVSHPQFASRAVAIVGTPFTAARDRQRWERALEDRRRTPRHTALWRAVRAGKPRTALYEWRLNRENYVRQGEAILAHDVRRRFGGALERAAAVVQSRLLVAVSPTDDDVEPIAAEAFARASGGEVLELDGRCGHQAPACERRRLWGRVSQFLAE